MRCRSEVDGLLAIRIENGRISGMYYVRDPPKLSHIGAEIPLARR
jgi:RNA polymerase sigma-70 factor (ECF subfamily)